MSIYHWKLGDIALARLCKKVYAKVQVVKDEKGLFYDDKGISANNSDTIKVTKELCYYIEISRTKQRLWLPYTSLHLAERSRPFYGPADKVSSPAKQTPVTRKRRIKEDHTVPLNVKLSKKDPDLNTTYDITHIPLKQGKYENAFKEFVRQGTETIFDHFYFNLKQNYEANVDCLDYLLNVNASTEDKLELVIKNVVTLKEIENYLHQCWKYNFVHKQMENNKDVSESSDPTSPSKTPVTLHVPWCLVCGKGDKLRHCPNCPSSFHPVCRREWLITIIHRKNPPKKTQIKVTLVDKILSSTRTKCTVQTEKENLALCPSCMWGPRVGYDDVVWHKLGSCPWWPARVLLPGAVPSCLLGRARSPHHWPLRYYACDCVILVVGTGTNNHSWADPSRVCLFLPSHTAALDSGRDPTLRQAVLDASDDYIAVYLT